MSQNYIALATLGFYFLYFVFITFAGQTYVQFNYAAPEEDHSPNYSLNNATGILTCATLLLRLYLLNAAANYERKLTGVKIDRLN